LLVTIVNGEKEGALQPWNSNRTAFAESSGLWRWPYILTTSPQISNVLAAALHQGLDRSLLSHLMGLLASIQAEAGHLGDAGGNGLEWRVIIDSLVRQNHRTRLSSRLAKKEMAELQTECATLRRELKAKTREAEMVESQRAALQAKHDGEIESVGQDWREEVLSLREAAEVREAEHASELKACVTENDLWEAKAREAEKRLDQAMQSHRQVESENASLKEEMRVLIFKLVQVEEVNATREDERRTWAEKFEEQQLAAAENDQRTAVAELALQSANSQLKKAASKLTVLAKAIQAKDEAARRADDRFEKLEKHISDIERDLVILRGRLVEVEGENRRLKALRQVETTERKREVQADKEEMERALEMVESLRELVRAQIEKIMELEYEQKQLLVNLKEKDGRLLQQVEALRRQHHAAAVIKSLAVPLEEAEDRMCIQIAAREF
jgi:DNA repair exonuclease SbcCD ATPase subunit